MQAATRRSDPRKHRQVGVLELGRHERRRFLRCSSAGLRRRPDTAAGGYADFGGFLTGERVTRRLAAILAADVVGYSRLMGRDEHGTLSRLKAHRTERLEPTLARHGGRLVKLTGDGALVEFPSAVDALSAAIEFQQAMSEANEDQPEDTRIVFRVGLHLGDLIVEDDDLYGDGVNIAARLEAEAPPGGVVISGDVHNAVAGRLKARFGDLGALSLKNIERSVQAFGVRWIPSDWKVAVSSTATPSLAMLPPTDAPLALPDKPSIAVLPFQNMSVDPEQEYFADGMVEDIITALSRFKSLFVIARNSSFTYKGKAVDIKQVGRELGVRYVLEGSVRKASGKVRITGQLIDVATGAHLWADRFEDSIEDIFDLQDQVTASVVSAVAPTLDRAEIDRVKRKPVENLDAYDCYLRGLALLYVVERAARDEALRYFYRAIELDPDFATPYGLAARCYLFRKSQGWIVDKAWEKSEARRLALRVAAIGRDDALALSWAGYALTFVCGDYDAGRALIDRAISVNPNLADCWQIQATVSLALGQPEAAVAQLSRALRFSPLDPEAYRPLGLMASAFSMQGKYDDALSWAAKSLAHQPNYLLANRVAAVANALSGRLEAARQCVCRIRELDPAMRISNLADYTGLRRPEDLAKLAEGLRLAGLPE